MFHRIAMPMPATSTSIMSAAKRPPLQRQSGKRDKPGSNQRRSSVGFGGRTRKDSTWRCVEGCGACCKLAKDFAFATPEEIFTDPSDVELYRSMIGPDGWCIHFEKTARKCSIYSDRPYFCRVEPEIFESLYRIDKKKFNKEACKHHQGNLRFWLKGTG